MYRLLAVVPLLASFASPVRGDERKAEPTIVAGSGWGAIRIGATKSQVVTALGTGQAPAKYRNTYCVDYSDKGVQVAYSTKDNTVTAVFFYNKQKGSTHFSTFQGSTSVGINWNSSVQEVIQKYGKPIRNYHGNDEGGPWQRRLFKGIDFRFENGKMVRIRVVAPRRPGDPAGVLIQRLLIAGMTVLCSEPVS